MRQAYSYARVSSGRQVASGYGMARQQSADTLTKVREWCAEHGYTLAEEHVMRDAGLSAIKGENLAAAAALGKFLTAIKASRVPRGSLLVVEHLNRLTRQDLRKALRLFLTILDAGVDILTWFDKKIYRENSEHIESDLIIAIVYMSEAYKASVAKMEYSLRLWERKRQEAIRAEGTKPLTRTCPAWLEFKNGRFVLPDDRAAIILRVFREVAAGDGCWTVAKRLNKEHVPPMNGGRMKHDANGDKTAEPISKQWNKSRINQIIHSDAVLGWMQPHVRTVGGKDYHRKPIGPPIKCYPPIPGLTQLIVNQARAKIASRRAIVSESGETKVKPLGAGRKGEVWSNLFTGIAKCAVCGKSMFLSHRNMRLNKQGWLRCTTAVRSDEDCTNRGSIPYGALECDIVQGIGKRALHATNLPGTSATVRKLVEKIALNTAEIERLQTTIANTMESFTEVASKAAAQNIAKCEARIAELTAESEKLNQTQQIEAMKPSTRDIAEQMLADFKNPEFANLREIRARMADGLRQLIGVIWCFPDRDICIRLNLGDIAVFSTHCLKDGIYHEWYLDYGPMETDTPDEDRGKIPGMLPREMKLAKRIYRRIMAAPEENAKFEKRRTQEAAE